MQVEGHPFFSLTYSAVKPHTTEPVEVMYRGPLPFLMTESGRLLQRGVVRAIDRHQAELLGDQIFILDGQGNAVNVQAENTCACCAPPEANEVSFAGSAPEQFTVPKQPAGCMACGAPLVYTRDRGHRCAFCGGAFASNSTCQNGHYVCDDCHARDGIEEIRRVCLHSGETDMIRLFEQIRRHPAIPVHGPEYHALVPAVILATYRNRGGDISAEVIESGIARGRSIAGGFCGFMGICGAAVGVGIAFSLLLDANPTRAAERRLVQGVTQSVLREIAKLKAARCCQRDCWIAFSKSVDLSRNLLPIELQADYRLVCGQQHLNRECLGKSLPPSPCRSANG